MAESDPKPLADLLFGTSLPDACEPEEELAKVLSAWFRIQRARLPDGASFGTPSAVFLEPRRQPRIG